MNWLLKILDPVIVMNVDCTQIGNGITDKLSASRFVLFVRSVMSVDFVPQTSSRLIVVQISLAGLFDLDTSFARDVAGSQMVA